MSSTHGLKTSERRLGSVGGTAVDGKTQETDLVTTEHKKCEKGVVSLILSSLHFKSQHFSFNVFDVPLLKERLYASKSTVRLLL